MEKRHGYQYEHIFSYNWNAMKGYHYLMRLGHLINILAIYSERLVKMLRELGVRGFIRFIRDMISGPYVRPSMGAETSCNSFSASFDIVIKRKLTISIEIHLK